MVYYFVMQSHLEGFYDPCIGETKQLFIEYTFNCDSYKATFEDSDVVRLPRATHKVQWWSRPFSSVKA
jgi:DnaJ family protein C protein 11